MDPAPVRVLVVQHDGVTPPGHLGAWLEKAGAVLDVRHPYAGDALPASLDDHDALLVLGGPMGADDDATVPWLTDCKRLLREAGERGVVALGVCLGHQLAGSAFGGQVGRNPGGQTVGVTPVHWDPGAAADPLLGACAPQPARSLHWNDDVLLEPPASAQVLSRTPDGHVQAARYARTVWGVQHHPEVDETHVRHWAEEDRTRHVDQGVDTDAALAGLAAARAELDATWRPLAERLLALVRED